MNLTYLQRYLHDHRLLQANGALTDQIDRTQSVIFYLESVGADINSKDKYGLTPLHFAAMRGNDVAALDLLHCDNIRIEMLTDKDNNNFGNPLHLAVDSGENDIIELCLNHNANVKQFVVAETHRYIQPVKAVT
ncbi:hypothetical protein BSL78_09819 [Apostichopus japonicus]|uniref:Uncharacterized protein n=1 Tax=Stichopus japonicus TaxID=307972 RepID=A0A2G8KZ74_STIJA|nr:hypothetical protein BSL78_09819 [Apostichopus japonicus]